MKKKTRRMLRKLAGVISAAVGINCSMLGTAEETDTIVIIGGADGPTSIFVAGKLGGETERPGILDAAVPVDENGVLSYLPNETIEENLMQELTLFGDRLLSACYTYDSEIGADILHLRLLSLETGELLCETNLQTGGSYAVKIQACGDRIAVCDAQGGVIRIFDESLQETAQCEVSGMAVYVDSNLTWAYCMTQAEGIHVQNLESGETQTILESARDLSVYSEDGDELSLRYIDADSPDKKECYAGLNLLDGTLECLETDDSFGGMEYCDGIWAGQLQAENQTYVMGAQGELFQFQLDASYPTLNLSGTPAILTVMTTETDGTQQMAAYDTDGEFLSSFSLKGIGGTLMLQQTWLDGEDGCFLIIIDPEGHDQLYFWDLTKEVSGESLELTPYGQKTENRGEVLEQSYYDRAAELSEAYGAVIKIADQCETSYSDKTAQQEYDTALIDAAFAVLEETLQAYPEGFFEQLYYGSYRTMEINLMGEIANTEEIEGHTPTAFVQHENGKITMVLNIRAGAEALEQNFYHESSHIIDEVIAHDALYRETACFSEETWQSLNPESFRALNPEYGGYYESYEIMPMEYYQEEFTPYFVIDYGKSFATEDRATIFEAAMMKKDARLSADGSLPLHAKLEYYCKCIRDCFDTTNWPEYTTWEEALL